VFQVGRTKHKSPYGMCLYEPAIALRESQKSPQLKAQFRVLVSITVTNAQAVAAVRARDHKTGARIVNLKNVAQSSG
jgi:hypothetical protein